MEFCQADFDEGKKDSGLRFEQRITELEEKMVVESRKWAAKNDTLQGREDGKLCRRK